MTVAYYRAISALGEMFVPSLYPRILAVIKDKALTKHEITRAVKADPGVVRVRLRTLHQKRLIHIASWEFIHTGQQIARYKVGDKQDAERLKPRGRKPRTWSARKRDVEMVLAEPKRLGFWGV